MHVVERFKLLDGGKTLQDTIMVEDTGAFNMAWSAVQRWQRRTAVRSRDQLRGEQ